MSTIEQQARRYRAMRWSATNERNGHPKIVKILEDFNLPEEPPATAAECDKIFDALADHLEENCIDISES
jgi:hypothetical protein